MLSDPWRQPTGQPAVKMSEKEERRSKRGRGRTGADASPAAVMEEASSSEEDPLVTKFVRAMRKESLRTEERFERKFKDVVSLMADTAKAQDAKWEKRMQEYREDILKEFAAHQQVAPSADSDLKARIEALERVHSGAGSVVSMPTTAMTVRAGDRKEPFVPSRVELRWIKKYPYDDAMGLQDVEVPAYLKALEDSDINTSMIDFDASVKSNRNVSNTKLYLKLVKVVPEGFRTIRQAAWSFKREFDGKSLAGDFHISGLPPKVHVQAEPEVEAMLSATGKMLGVLCGLGAANEKLKPNWTPAKVYFRSPSRCILLVEWSAKEGYGVKDENLRKWLPQVETTELLRRLRE